MRAIVAILGEESILTVAAYIDLNPVADGICPLPEQSPHTSIQERVEHAVAQGRLQLQLSLYMQIPSATGPAHGW